MRFKNSISRFAALSLTAAFMSTASLVSASTPPATASPAAAAAGAASLSGAAAARPGFEAPDFTLPDAQGKTHSLSAYRGKWVVLEWVNYDCPFVRKHYGSGNMQKLQQAAKDKGVVWLSINSSAPGKQGHFEGAELTARIAKAKAVPAAYLLDPEGKVGRLYKAKTTPSMFVINPEGKVIYAGAIDNHPSTEPDDIKTSKNYVQAALDAGIAGKPLETTTTASYGCGVKYKD